MNNSKCRRVVNVLGQLCNPVRINVLCALSQGSCTVNELAKRSGTKLNNVSQHLKMLELSGLIEKQRRGKFVVCSIKDKRVLKLLGCLEKYF